MDIKRELTDIPSNKDYKVVMSYELVLKGLSKKERIV